MVLARTFGILVAFGSIFPFGTTARSADPQTKASAPRKPNVWAILIAIDHYEAGDSVIPPCPGAARDVRALGTWLQRQGGWPADHILILDRLSQRRHGGPLEDLANVYPSRDNLGWVLNQWLPARVRDGDLVLIYYAGQAVGLPPALDALPGTAARNYLLPIDADVRDLDRTGWAIQNDLDVLAAKGRNPILVWLDTSLSGRGKPVLPNLSVSDSANWLATIARWPGISAWLAASGRPSADANPSHVAQESGPFVSAVIQGLGSPNEHRNVLACLATLRMDAVLASQGFRTHGGVAPDITLWSTDLTLPPELPSELVLTRGHSDRVLDVACSADSATLFSAGADSTVKVWRAEDRSLLRTLANHFVGVTRLAMSPDGKFLASGDGTGRVWVYEMPEFRALSTRAQRPHDGPVTALAFVDDGRRLVSLDSQGKALLWRINGREIEPSPLAEHPIMAFDAGDGRIATAYIHPIDSNSRLTIFDREGVAIADRPGPGGVITQGRLNIRNGRLAVGDDKGAVALWRFGAPDDEPELVRLDRLDRPVRVVCLATSGGLVAAGSTIHWIPNDADQAPERWDAGGTVSVLAATEDARYVAVALDDGRVRLWDRTDADHPREIEQLVVNREEDDSSPVVATSLTFSPGGTVLIAGCQDGGIRTWILPDGVARPEIPGHRGQIRALALTPDARHLLQITIDGEASLWDLELGRALQPIPGRWTAGITLPDNASLSMTGEDGEIALIDRTTGDRLERTFERPKIPGRNVPTQAAFDLVDASPDGRYLAGASTASNLACLWDLATGRLMRPFRAHPDGVAAIRFSSDSSRLLTAGFDGAVLIWAVEGPEDRPPIFTIRAEAASGPITIAAFDPTNPDRIALGDQGGRVVVWSIEDQSRPIAKELMRLDGAVRALVFTHDGSRLVAAGEDKAVRLVDFMRDENRTIRLDPLHDEQITALVAWPNAPLVASGSADTTIRLWKLDEPRWLGTLAGSPRTGDWIAFTPEGRFDSSPGAERGLAYVNASGAVTPLEQAYDRLRAFRMTALLRRGAAPESVPPFGETPPLILAIDPVPARSLTRIVELSVTFPEPSLSGARLYLNGVPIRNAEDFIRPDPANPTRRTVQAPLRRGHNELYVMAGRDEPGAAEGRSNAISVLYDGPERPGRLHILALGVDDYPNRPLKFSATDAATLADFLERNHVDGLREGARVEVLANGQVTRDAVRAALASIRAEARPEDTVAVFVAGHTAVRSDEIGRDRFCLLLPEFPFPTIDDSILEQTGIRVALRGNVPEAALPRSDPPDTVLPYAEIERFLVRMDALQRLVIIDACQAEAAVEDQAARRIRENVAEKVDDDAHRARTTYLLASRRDMPALEVDPLGHGLLTYTLLRGMGADGLVDVPEVPHAGADIDGDALITTTELRSYTDRILPTLAARYASLASRDLGSLPRPRQGPVVGTRSASEPLSPAGVQGADGGSFALTRLP